jgi:hypothetical protein
VSGWIGSSLGNDSLDIVRADANSARIGDGDADFVEMTGIGAPGSTEYEDKIPVLLV